MFTVDFKVNGKTVVMMEGRNLGYVKKGNTLCRYSYTLTRIDLTTNDIEDSKVGFVIHDRDKGLEELVRLCLSDSGGVKIEKEDYA